ncbi:FAD synthetase [Apis cerana cerana]|uniref:FAD synthetase n=1 Tax=Apis cerana cerana TaxID=94128 RepID=A0A2A3EN22_APICC|nr:FAD synthetase [Apis cerana cerana]
MYILIGDEILKAQVKDTNYFYACKLLYKYGVKVQKIAIVRDNLQDIAKEIKYFSKMFNYVFTSGGIGPTHDDLTYEAIALAFNDTLHYHPTLVDIIKNYFDLQDLYGTFPLPAYKMAYIPTKSVLKFGKDEVTGKMLTYPYVIIENVYIFPGSPVFFEKSFQTLCKEYFTYCKKFATTEIYINAKEESFADILRKVALEYSNVTFGSYPERNRNYYEKPEEIWIYLDGSEESIIMIHLARVVSNKLRYCSKMKLRAICFKSDILKSEINEFFNEIKNMYNIELCKLEYEENDVVRAIKNFTLLKPELRKLLIGKRLNSNEREIYNNLERLNDNSTQFNNEICKNPVNF